MMKLIHTNTGTFYIGKDGLTYAYNATRTSIHEAGHTVLAYRLGSTVHKVSVLGFSDEEDDALDAQQFNGHCVRMMNADKDNDAVITLAGYYAERILLDRRIPRLETDSIPSEIVGEICHALALVESKDKSRDLKEAFTHVHITTKNLVLDNERDIVNVAKELRKRKLLTADDVSALLGDFTDNSASKKQVKQFIREMRVKRWLGRFVKSKTSQDTCPAQDTQALR